MTIRVPTCSKCARSSILHQAYSGQDLCRAHLLESVRKRVARELRAQVRIPDHHDPTNPYRILVAVSGGKDSSVLLERMVDLLGPRQDVELLAHVWMRASKDIEHHRLNLPAPSAPD